MFWYFCQSSWQLALLALATYACLAIVIPIYFANILQVLLKAKMKVEKITCLIFREFTISQRSFAISGIRRAI